MSKPQTFQGLIEALQNFWKQKGCIIMQPFDQEVGAGTFHPATFLRAIGPEPWQAAYVQPSRRPTDGRYGDNPHRGQHYFQFQVVLKPAPDDILTWYCDSLAAIGLSTSEHDIRFVEDNWESPTLGAWGLGWEVWLNGLEVSQFTYFQQVGGLSCQPVMVELTYGLERIAMTLQGVDSMYDCCWAEMGDYRLTYGDIYQANEQEMSAYHFELVPIEQTIEAFAACERQVALCIERGLAIPAYEQVLKASHAFNCLDARGAISVTERQQYILRVRQLAQQVAQAYFQSRQQQGFPLLKTEQDAYVS